MLTRLPHYRQKLKMLSHDLLPVWIYATKNGNRFTLLPP